MSRLNTLKSLEKHPWLGRSFAVLSKRERSLMYDFVRDTELLNKDEYAHAAMRLFLDREKPKNWSRIEEILISVLAG